MATIDRHHTRRFPLGRHPAAAAVLAAGALALLAVAPEPVEATTPPTTVLLMAQPAGNAAAAIHLADGSTIDPAPIGREVELPSRPTGVQVLLFAGEGETGVSQPNVDLALQATTVYCAIVIDGQVLDQSGPAQVASCQWDG